MRLRSILAMVLVLSMLLSLIPTTFAESSAQIQEKIDELEEEADRINEQISALEDNIHQKEGELLSFSEKKFQIDQEIELLQQSVDNINAQIRQNSILIAQRQAELNAITAEYNELCAKYQLRMRTIQERGEVTILSVIFSAKNFSEMFNYQVMKEEIAISDNIMMAELVSSANLIRESKDQLAEDKSELQNRRNELDKANQLLEEKCAEADAMIAELNADKRALAEELEKWEEEEQKLIDEIAAAEKEYTRQMLIESGGQAYIPTESRFIFPLSLNGYVRFTSPYGMRTNPVTGVYCLHNGVDFGAYKGTPIYASKSGVVTTACLGGGWGNYVVINHGDGFSSLYAHMTSYCVSYNDYVEQGQVIGYVGSTGNSTGPHLHFTIFYDGASVNPMMYITLP